MTKSYNNTDAYNQICDAIRTSSECNTDIRQSGKEKKSVNYQLISLRNNRNNSVQGSYVV